MAHICMILIGDIRYDGRVRKEIGTLTEAGHEVDLVVSDFGKARSGGEDLGVTIHHIPMTLWPRASMNFLEQLWFNRKAASIIKTLGPSHIHCHDLNSLLAGVWSKEKINATLIFDAHELMPESMWGIRKKIWHAIEKWCIKSCDHVIMPEKNRIAYFREKHPGVQDILLLSNYPREKDIPEKKYDLFRKIYSIRKEQKIILYTGLIAAKRHLEELIHSMAICSEEFTLVILGQAFKGYEEMLQIQVKTLGLTNRVFFHASVPHAEILPYMASCDIGTAFYRNTNLNNYYCASNKLYEYIALDKAVLTNNYPGLLEDVGHFNQGICLEEITPKILAESYIRVSHNDLITPGAKKFFWEDEEHSLVEFYESMV